jgi:hypothetical protein
MSIVKIQGDVSGTGTLTIAAPNTNSDFTITLPSASGTLATTETAGFPAGTVMMFVQTAAPTGWTKSTTHNDKALRVVSGTASSGGTTAFSTVFANQTPTITTSGLSAGATTLTTAQIPSHNHNTVSQSYGGTAGLYAQSSSCCAPVGIATVGGARIQGGQYTTTSAGSGGSHTHSISGSATSSAITLNVQYVDVIIATKN